MSSTGTGATASQDFEVSLDSFDAFAGDDFQVSSGEVVVVNKIVVRGIYFNGAGPVESFNVGYNGGLLTGLGYTQNGDEFTIPLPPSGPLTRNIYFVSVQAKMDFGSGGQWAWLDRDQQFFGFPAYWQNPGGGYGIPQCTDHNDKRGEICGIDPGFPEQAFRVEGHNYTGGPCSGTPTASPTPTFTWTPTATATNTATPTASPSPIHVSLGTAFASQGSVITVPITVGDTTGRGINSYDLQVTYQSVYLTPWQSGFDQTGTLSSGMSITSDTSNVGLNISHLIISASQATNLTGSGTLLNLKFLVDHAPGTCPLILENYTDPGNVFHPGFRFNNGSPPATTSNGAVVVMNTPTNTPTYKPTNTATATATSTPTSTPLPVCSPLFLWDQMAGGTGTNGTASQDFETASDAFDAEVADDFQLGSGTAVVINKIIARGIYFNGSGPADSFNVRFYGGCSTPCGLGREFTGLSYTQDGDKFIINIPNFSTNLLTGWVSVQARMDFSSGGQWAWLNREQYQFMGPSTWRNPGGGYSIPQCVNFAQRGATCNIDPAYPDQAFQIIGYRPAGACTVPPAASISGTVTYGNAIPAATRPVSNVLVSGAGSVPVSATTGFPNGDYVLSGFGSGSYMVMPTKTGGVNNISSFDAARVAQHVAAINPLTGSQLIVADTSGNGTISSFDAGQIARYVAALSGFGATGNWIFGPVNRSYASVTSNVTGEDYSALLMGEVSGNWTNTGARPESGRQSAAGDDTPEIVVDLPVVSAEAGKEITIPVNVRGAANKGIISYEFNLKYDPSVIQPQKDPVDLTNTVSRSLTAVTNVEEPGLLRVVIYGAFPIAEDGILLNLRFNAVGGSGSSSPITWEQIMLNEGDPATMTSDGQVEISVAVTD